MLIVFWTGRLSSSLRTPLLSKTDFITGLQCPLALWLRVHDRGAAAYPDADQLLRFAAGNVVDELAREAYPGGALVRAHGLLAAGIETEELLAAGASRIYQATVATALGGCMADVLDVHSDGACTLREVKSVTSVREHHVVDLAFQVFAFQSAGHWIDRALIVHLNPEAQPAARFVEVDVTDRVMSLLPGVQADAKGRAEVAEGERPDVAIGSHCREPYPCPFQQACWTDVPDRSVFTVPGLSSRQLDVAIAAGRLEAGQLSPARLPRAAREYVTLINEGPSIDADLLRKWARSLLEPVSVLDIIGFRPPVSDLPGTRPYSLSICGAGLLGSDGTLEVFALPGVPLSADVDALVDGILESAGSGGHVVVWNREYVLEGFRFLRRVAPMSAGRLRSFEMRLIDVEPLIGTALRDPDFLARTSLDAVGHVVLPNVEVPTLGDLVLQLSPDGAGVPLEDFDLGRFNAGVALRLQVLSRVLEIARAGAS